MTTKECMDLADSHLLHVYNRFPLVLDHGDGVYLYDLDGKEYLDFGSGIGVFGLGYNYKKYNDALKAQIDKLIHTSNLFYNAPAALAGEKICEFSGMDRVFFTNSGTEANEGAIKLARKYAYNRDHGSTDHEIIAMKHSFHGRSMGALSVTGNEHYQEAFRPLIGGVKFANFNDLESVKALVTKKTCAIMLEPVQGEGGLYPASEEFIQGIRKICDDHDILMICDEVQCGMGRTGRMLALENYGVKADIITFAKALGCGVPVGAFAAREEVASAMVPGDHGTTYGGNPFACAAVNVVLDIFKEDKILDHVKEVGFYMDQKLAELVGELPNVIGHRGKGLMQGLALAPEKPVGEVVKACLEKGLITLSAEGNVLRLLPPLVISKTDVDKMILILKTLL